jgi:hypothetical protein
MFPGVGEGGQVLLASSIPAPGLPLAGTAEGSGTKHCQGFSPRELP